MPDTQPAKFNICFVQPEGYVHALAFVELVELLYFSLKDLGHFVKISQNKLARGQTNIVIGCHLLDPALIGRLPEDTILLNTEQICDDDKSWNENIFNWFKAGLEVWDYSGRNIERFKSLGIPNVKKFNLGYQPELVRIEKKAVKDIDVLFYGCLNERRRLVLQRLIRAGLKVKALFGVFGKERDEWIGRSKLVLNHHFHRSEIFEVVRVFYLLTNSVAVVGEVNPTTSIEPHFRQGIMGCPYDELVDTTVELARDHEKRLEIENRGFAAISKTPQVNFTKAML